jgi:hypothetical protein
MSKVIATIAIGAVLIGGGLWLNSGEGPLPEKFRYHKDSVFKWTPENIGENPEQRTVMHEKDILCKPSPTLNLLKLIHRVNDFE